MVFFPDNSGIKGTIVLGLCLLVGYILIFMLFFGRTNAAIAALAVIPVIFIGWRTGSRVGLVAGLLSLPLNTLLFNLAGVKGIDVVFRLDGGFGTLIIILLGAAAGYVRDITRELSKQIRINKLNEEALRKSEERYRSLFDGVPMGIYRTTPEGNILAANSALLALLGYHEKEPLISMNVKNLFVDEQDRERWKRQIEAQGTIRGFQLALRRPDGSTLWVEDNAHIVRDERGKVAYYEGSLNDITERKRAEQAVLESEAKYRNLLHNIPQRVFYKNTDLVYVAVNANYARDFNLSPEEFVGKTDLDFYPPDVAEKYRSDDRRILELGIAEDLEEDYVHHGEKKTVHTIKSPVHDERGEIAGILGIFWDITDRTQMEAALRQSEQRYQGLFERSPVSLWEEDFSGVKQAIERLKIEGVRDFETYFDEHPEAVLECLAMIKVTDVNYATLHLYQAESKADLLDNLDKIFTQSAYDIFREELLAIVAGRTVFESEGQNCTLTGETIDLHLRWSAAPGYEDSLSKVFVSIVDISERKRAEQALQRQTAKAEALAGISKALSAAGLETQATFEVIVEQVADLIGDACMLTLICEDNQWTRVVAVHHRQAEANRLMQHMISSSQKRAGEGASGRVMKTGEALFVPVVSSAAIEALGDPELEAYLYRSGVHSLLIIPLVAQGQVIGTLGMMRHRPGKPYTGEERSFLESLAIHVALTIMNARLHELVRHQARTDALTGAYNRRYFLSQAELEFSRAERYGKPLSIILLDLDHFKDVNDTYGHHTGDDVLQSVAERFRDNIRPADIMGRYGGEEFTILLPETDLAGARQLADRLRTQIADVPVDDKGESIRVTVSLGVASKGDDTPDVDALLHKADEAMYEAKRAGRNQVRGS
ncbi:MAG TPA: diguanylate cyclase [Anaerolineales bacterium]